jgi:hypothetical protein
MTSGVFSVPPKAMFPTLITGRGAIFGLKTPRSYKIFLTWEPNLERREKIRSRNVIPFGLYIIHFVLATTSKYSSLPRDGEDIDVLVIAKD